PRHRLTIVEVHRLVEIANQSGVVRHAPTLPPGRVGAARRVRSILRHLGAWRSLVARTVRVGEVPGSNPGAPISAGGSAVSARQTAGTCCVMQWMFPPPRGISRAGTPTTSRSGKHPPRI